MNYCRLSEGGISSPSGYARPQVPDATKPLVSSGSHVIRPFSAADFLGAAMLL